MTVEEGAMEVRSDAELWFTGFARVKDLVTQQPVRAKAKPLQRRGWAHYKTCQDAGVPCRQVWVKGRRAGGSDGCAALVYLHANNYQARLGQIGTNYRTAHNMLEKVKFFGEHDEFPGWSARGETKIEQRTVSAEDFYGGELDHVPWGERTEKVIEAKIEWPHGSAVELYTAENPESARSAGLQGFHWTEFFRAPNGGAKDAGETLNAMVKTVPKRGFTFIALEGTANGAAGAGYELVKTARWPEESDWWRQWEIMWPQNVAEIGKELQFVLIFAAWFEDCENTLECTHAEQEAIRASLDQTERTLIDRYQCEGPRGPRLGAEVDTTVWNQLKWRRATILYECKAMGAQEFAQEWPSDPEEAFRASGSPALDIEGVRALEIMARQGYDNCTCNHVPQYGQLSLEKSGGVSWRTTEAPQATVARWEEPIETADGGRGCRYLVSCDPMTGADQVTGHGEKDRHAVFVLRGAYTNHRGKYQRVRVVARIVPPCQWEDEVLAKQLYYLSLYYGGATIAVEANQGMAILKALANDYGANVDQREEFDKVTQKTTKQLGWWNNAQTRRSAISTLQLFVREQLVEVFCRHAVAELMTLIIDAKGKARASGSNHDDDCLGLALALERLPAAHEYPPPTRVRTQDWTGMRTWRAGCRLSGTT